MRARSLAMRFLMLIVIGACASVPRALHSQSVVPDRIYLNARVWTGEDGIHAAVTRQMPDGTPVDGWYPEHRISVAAALLHFTRDAAYAGFGERDKGTLVVGKLADFVVLSKDVLSVPAAQLLTTRVLLTVMGGRETWREATLR